MSAIILLFRLRVMKTWILAVKGHILYLLGLTFALVMTSTLFGSHVRCKFNDMRMTLSFLLISDVVNIYLFVLF